MLKLLYLNFVQTVFQDNFVQTFFLTDCPNINSTILCIVIKINSSLLFTAIHTLGWGENLPNLIN